METKTRHTPTPWTTTNVVKRGWTYAEINAVKDGEFHRHVAEVLLGRHSTQNYSDESVANAEFIVRAVNAYNDHLETIRWVANTVHQAHHESGVWSECDKNTCLAARKAIAKAEGA